MEDDLHDRLAHREAVKANDDTHYLHECRDCGTPYWIKKDLVDGRRRNKWNSLCPSCLQFEI